MHSHLEFALKLSSTRVMLKDTSDSNFIPTYLVLSVLQPDIEAAITSTKKTINIAHANRKKQSVIQAIKLISQKTDYSSYTDGIYPTFTFTIGLEQSTQK